MKRTLYLVNALWVTATFAAIMFFLNAISQEGRSRRDLTEESLFTLDPLSEEIAGRFDDTVFARYYVTPDQFPPGAEWETLARDVSDRLDEYAAVSKGRIRVEVIDPRPDKKEIDSKTREKLEADGVTVSAETVKRDDKPFPREFYSTIRLTYGEKTEIVGDVKTLANLEYQLTNALRRLQVKSLPKVGFLFSGEQQGFGREGIYQSIPEILRRDFLVDTVTLGEKDPVPDDVDVLFVVAPERVPDRHKFAIDQYLMNGRKIEVDKSSLAFGPLKEGEAEFERKPGKVVFLLDVFDESQERRINRQQYGQPPIYSKIDSGLTDILAHFGVNPRSNLVLDLDKCAYGQIPARVFVRGVGFIEKMKTVQWPRIILTRSENYNTDLAFVNRLDNVAFIDALSLAATDPLPAGIEYVPVIRSSKTSWEVDFKDSPFIVGTQIETLHEEPDNKQSQAVIEGRGGLNYPLVGLWRGRFKSFYAGKQVPPPEMKKDDPDAEVSKPAVEDKPPGIVEKTLTRRLRMKGDQIVNEKNEDAASRIIVVGDSHIFSDHVYRHQHKPNIDFLVNMIDWLTAEESLSMIKAKGVKPRPLDKQNRTLITVLLVSCVPSLVIVIGAAVLLFRRIDKVTWLKNLQSSASGAPRQDSPGGGATNDAAGKAGPGKPEEKGK